ncbi:hypothetical protein ACIQM4_11530 [Streptomyces sp. NPDC091272]|uniref:hypothetical protein n=1 Tax=Streptomyces sp. NPDC091272 TaxID=3365981 RepID=UPI00381AABCB
MSDEQATPEVTGLRAFPTTVITPETSDVTLLPVDEVKPEDIGSLSLRYVDGTATLVVSGGKALPAELPVVDGQGNPVAIFTGGPLKIALKARSAAPSESKTYDNLRYVFEYEFNPDGDL